jgi:hypothetical protein
MQRYDVAVSYGSMQELISSFDLDQLPSNDERVLQAITDFAYNSQTGFHAHFSEYDWRCMNL